MHRCPRAETPSLGRQRPPEKGAELPCILRQQKNRGYQHLAAVDTAPTDLIVIHPFASNVKRRVGDLANLSRTNFPTVVFWRSQLPPALREGNIESTLIGVINYASE